ncbi:MAG: ABC transporter ATP-binding protein [Candidatus Aenigmarchaeota archaeon]|nr:ABC transporter ATP-binding protein [Candidatus Aenigmarchaeota archaeon]
MAKRAVFKLEKITKQYRMGEDVVTNALCGIDIEIENGEYVAIIGPSGSGKSTLMHIMGCLDSPTKGRVFIEGIDVSKMKDNELAVVRREKLGFVFQAYNLVNTLTAVENVALPMRFAGVGRGEAVRRARELLKKVGLTDRMGHKPNQLSGGQQQRVAIARSLINDPDIILADEPTGNLDTKSGQEIVELLESLNRKMGKTIVVVTHHLGLAQRADRRIYIKDGKVEREERKASRKRRR